MRLREYQEEAIEAIYDYFRSNSGNPVIALPTGTGKSLVIAGFVHRVFKRKPQRIIMATHVKKLIEQNAAKLRNAWPLAPLGIYSAGLKQKDTWFPITFAGVASIVRRIEEFHHIDLLIIDEAHLVGTNDAGMYLKIIKALLEINPRMKVIGLSATPYRMGTGLLSNGPIFTDIAYDRTKPEDFKYFIDNGWLAPLRSRPTENEIDLKGIRKDNHGDYNTRQVEERINHYHKLLPALEEMVSHGGNRRSWLAFAPGIETAENIAKILRSLGVKAYALHSKLTQERQTAIEQAWLTGKIKCAVTNNMLTTGVDHPALDLIAMFRPTTSVPLWVQMLGRGTRPFDWDRLDDDEKERLIAFEGYHKSNCLCLDYARNIVLGPIDDPIVPKAKKKGEPGEMPVKICDECGDWNHTRAAFCDNCGAEFKFSLHITKEASTKPVMSTEFVADVFEEFQVEYSRYAKYENKTTGNVTIRANYMCGRARFSEFVGIGEKSWQRRQFAAWWKCRHKSPPPDKIEDAEQFFNELTGPRRIRVHMNHKSGYPRIVDYDYGN